VDAPDKIVNIKKEDNPEYSGTYTREWALFFCSVMGKTPEEMWAYLEEIKKQNKAYSVLPPDQNMPEWYKEKFTGPVDSFSYGLMKDDGWVGNEDPEKQGPK